MSDNVKDWITINGNHIPVKEGQTKSEAANNFLKEKAEKGKMRIKKGLKKTEDISKYVKEKLEKVGYEIETHHSGLSDSEYITIKNAGELFGKADTDDVEIRIATHDLPPTYDKQYQGDFDIRSGEDNSRHGTNNDAMNYDDFLAILLKKKGIATPEYDQKQKQLEAEREEQKQRNLAYYQNERDKADGREKALEYIKNNMPDKYKEVQSLYAKADTVTGDKRKQLRKQANKILNEIAETL